jgi:hypothetical protein
MMRALCLGPLNPLSCCVSAEDAPAPQQSWETAHQVFLRRMLRDAQQGTVRSWQSAQFSTGEGDSVSDIAMPGAHSSVLKGVLSLAPDFTHHGLEVPRGPQLLALASPEQEGQPLAELVNLLMKRGVGHLLVLGRVSNDAMRVDRGNQPLSHLTAFNNIPILLRTSAAQPMDQCLASELTLITGLSNEPPTPNAILPRQSHVLQMLRVPLEEPALLNPDELRTTVTWARDRMKDGAPLAIIAQDTPPRGQARDDRTQPLLAMTGQLALVFSLLRQQGPSTGDTGNWAERQQRLLTEGATELHGLNPGYLGTERHLSAVLAAHTDLSDITLSHLRLPRTPMSASSATTSEA